MCRDSSGHLTPRIVFSPEPVVYSFFPILVLFEKLNGLHGAALVL